MTVKQDDFRDLFASDLAFATQAQHVFGVLSLALVPNPGLAGKKMAGSLRAEGYREG